MDIDLDIEKQITELQEAKIQQNLKKVVPEDFDTQLGTFFSTISEKKIELKEKVQKDEIKIKEFEKLFSELNAKKEAVKEKKVEKKKEPKRDEASAIKTQEVEGLCARVQGRSPKPAD